MNLLLILTSANKKRPIFGVFYFVFSWPMWVVEINRSVSEVPAKRNKLQAAITNTTQKKESKITENPGSGGSDREILQESSPQR